MKKLIALSLCVLFVLAVFSGCKAKTPLEIYYDAASKINSADSIDSDFSALMEIRGDGVSMDATFTGNSKRELGENPRAVMEMAVEMMGMKIDTTAYLEGEWMYMEVLGQKVKVKNSAADIQIPETSYSLFAEEMIKESSVEKTAQGTEGTLVIDAKKLPKEDIFDLLGELESVVEQAADVSFDTITMKYVIGKDGIMKSTTVSFDFVMAMGAQGVEVSFSMEMIINQVGGVKLEFPDDLDAYEELQLP